MGKFLSKEEMIGLKKMALNGEITSEELQNIIIDSDPCLWAEAYLCDPDNHEEPLSLRPYQREVLSKDVKSIAVRWGRQIGKTVALTVRILWELCTEPNVTIAFFAPKKKHISDVFNYIEKMIGNSPTVSKMINKGDIKSAIGKRSEDSIISIEFRNGSRIQFFHTQGKSARELIRGTRADKLFFDEAAFIDENTFAALSGLLVSSQNLFIWAQSTPLGKSGWFYEFCLNADFESHHTSLESPSWNAEKEATARLLAGDEQTYKREYLAEFVSGGVYAFSDYATDIMVELAKSESGNLFYRDSRFLDSEQIKSIPGKIYIGLDWNIAANGTKIVVFKSPSFEHSMLYYQEVYSIEEPVFTQRTAVEKLFELIEELRPSGIGIDKGYASGSLEFIAEKLEDPRYEHLKEKVHIIDMGESIKVPVQEFFTGKNMSFETVEDIERLRVSGEEEEYIKMRLKNFMVSTMNKLILNHKLAVGPVDYKKEKKTLISEIKSVKVEYYTEDGIPVYSKKDIHKFAASLLAIYSHFIDYGRYKISKENGKKVLRKTVEETEKVSKSIIYDWIADLTKTENGSIHSRQKIRDEVRRNIKERTNVNLLVEDGVISLKYLSKNNNPFSRINRIKGSRRI